MNTILNASIVSPAVLGLTSSFFSLVAIWAALSTRHWFQRFVIILLVPLPLLMLPNPEQRLAHGLYIDFALQMLFVATVTIVGRCVWHAAVDRRWPFGKFSLSDLCLAVVACSLIFGGVTWPSEGPFAYIDWPICIYFAATAAISVWGALGRQPTLARGLACVVIVIGIGIVVRSSISPGIGVLSNDWTLCAAIWLQSGAILISLLLFRYRQEHHTQDRILAAGWIVRLTLFAVGLALVVPLCVAYAYLVRPIAIPDVSLPCPNAYERLLASGRQVDWGNGNIFQVADPSPGQLRSFVEKNREAFEIADATRGLASRVPVDYATFRTREENQSFRDLARARCFRGSLALKEGRVDDARQCFLDVVEGGFQCQVGGLVIHRLVAGAIVRMGLERLRGMASLMSASQCESIADTLTKLDGDLEPIDDVLARDDRQLQLSMGWMGRAHVLFQPSFSDDLQRAADKQFRGELRLATCEWAIRKFELENGRFPNDLAEVAPQFSGSVLTDPFDGRPVKFVEGTCGFTIYCVGRNGIDDQGDHDEDGPLLIFLSDGKSHLVDGASGATDDMVWQLFELIQ